MLESLEHTTLIPFCVKGKNYKINFIPRFIDDVSFSLELIGHSIPKGMRERFDAASSVVIMAANHNSLLGLFNYPDPLVRYVARSVYLLINFPQGNA